MNPQHLSDEAVAAAADGVLTGHARERATRHVEACAECRQAVRVQREAAFALRAAAAPALPSALLERLRTVPQTTPIPAPASGLPVAIASDGTPMLSTFAPAAALVPVQSRSAHRLRPFVTTAAIVALAGSLAAGSVASDAAAQPGTGRLVGHSNTGSGSAPQVIDPVSFFRGSQP